jgi:hypothetical protein
MFLRSVQPATVLPEGEPVGDAAEDATRRAAAFWGLPDFVFRARQRPLGRATREVGDAIVVAGQLAACVQVKARQQVTSNQARERLWLDKKIAQATSQARGTIKSFSSAGGLELENERGRTIHIAGQAKSWIPVVVLDHPGASGYIPTRGAVVLLRRDWEFLFEQLKSTYAVLEYLLRVSTDDPVALGDEPVRYYELAAADASMAPAPVDARVAHLGPGVNAPLLPRPPAGHADIKHFSVLRVVLEDIAISPRPTGVTEADVLEILGAIEAAPIAHREDLGKVWITWLEKVAKAPRGHTDWRFRSLLGNNRPYLIFAAATRHDEVVMDAFRAFVSVRHHQHLELMPERKGMLTVGLLLTPRRDKFRPWDTSMIATRETEVVDLQYQLVANAFWGDLGERDHQVNWAEVQSLIAKGQIAADDREPVPD